MEIAACIATGPSLTQADVDYCKGKARVYAVNDVYKIAPWADILYAADDSWWDHHGGVPDFQGQKYTVNPDAAKKFGLNFIDCKSTIDWSDNPAFIATGGNSGFQAMNLAALHGAEKIILLGFDYGFKGKKHFFGEHPKPIDRPSDYHTWLKKINKAALHIKIPVVNCSRESAINCFPRKSLEAAFADN